MPQLPIVGYPTPDDDPGAQDPELQRIVDQINNQALSRWAKSAPQAEVLPPEAAQPAWMNQTAEQYLAENPDHVPFDFSMDPEAATALMPESPPLPWFRDSSHPEHNSRAGKLLRILAYGMMGAAAGAGSKTVSEGFSRGQAAAQNLLNLQMQRQQQKDLSQYRQAQTQRLQMQTEMMPQQMATLEDYRRARQQYLDAQTERIRQQAEDLKRGKNDKLLHSYTGSDNRMHFLFQRSDGNTYERTGEQDVYQKPQPEHRPLLAHGPDSSVYLIDPQTGHSRLIIPGKKGVKPRVADPGYFQAVEEYKTREWAKIKNDLSLSEEDKLRKLDHLQKHYEKLIRTGGGTIGSPYDVRSGTRPTQAPSGQGFWSQVPGAVQRH